MKWPWQKNNKSYTATIAGPASTDAGRLNVHSETWNFIQNYCKKRLDELRALNDNMHVDAVKTTMLRGQVKMLKEIIALPNSKPRVDWKDSNDIFEGKYY